MKDLDRYLEDAINNINNDREVTKSLLEDVMILLSKNDLQHKEIGPIAAKYVETLQRSNEQLVKIAALLQKRETKEQGLTSSDKEELFDLIQGEE
jgi:hypothetical protein